MSYEHDICFATFDDRSYVVTHRGWRRLPPGVFPPGVSDAK